jgi:hypothetical protein
MKPFHDMRERKQMYEINASKYPADFDKKTPRGKHHNKTKDKTTVSLYLDRVIIENARKRGLNLSRVTEQALSSILEYFEPQKSQNSSNLSLSRGSLFPKEKSFGVPRAGFEPATTRSSAERSPRLSYLGS